MNISTINQSHKDRPREQDCNKIDPLTVTLPTALKLTGLGATKMWELIKTGDVESVKVGKRRLVIYASLTRLLDPRSAKEQ